MEKINSQEQNNELILNAREAEVVHPQKGQSQPFRVYDSQSDWQDEIDRIIGKRLKEKRENESVAEKYRRLSKLLNYYFGTDNVLSLQTVFANMKRAAYAQSLVQQADEKRLASGMDERKADIKRAVEAYAQKTGRDMRSLAENKDFLRYLWENGVDPEEADLLANRGNIREDALEKAKQSIAASLAAKKNRIAENGMTGLQSAKKRKLNPDALTNADIDDIMRRAQSGERISF